MRLGKCVLPLLLFILSANLMAQPLFNIEYQVIRGSKPFMKLSLYAHAINDEIFMAGGFLPRGLIAKLLVGSGTVKTRSYQYANHFVPNVFTIEFQNFLGRDTHQQFNPDKLSVVVKYGQREKELSIPVHVHSLASMHLQLSIDAQQGKEMMSYDVISKNKRRHYTLFRRTEEIIDTPLGQLQTIVFERQKNDSTDFLYWLSPTHSYLPIKGEHFRKGKIDYTVLATTITIETPLSAEH